MADTLNRILKNAKLLTEAVQFDTYNFTIGTHFLSPLINGDYTGFSYDDQDGKDEAALEAFLAKIPNGGHWDYESGDEGYFGRDEITGLRGQVIDVKYYVPKREEPQMGEDKPKKRVLPKRPAKRPNDDNIAGAYKELDKQKWQNAEKSMKTPQK